MNANKIILPAITGTSLMTLFSYLASMLEKKNFSEPELLAALEKPALPGELKKLDLPAGWATHYSTGILFTLLYEYILRKTNSKPTLANGIALGGISGIAGIFIWKLSFKAHPAPPRTDYRKYYRQLLLAHFVFGISVALLRRKMAEPGKKTLKETFSF